MPRRSYTPRETQPDLVYNSVAVAKLINMVMKDGKKSIAQSMVYGALSNIEKKKKIKPAEIMEKVIENVGPRFVVRPRRVGGASYMVPREVTAKHRFFLAIKWLVDAARSKSNSEYKTFQKKLEAELIDAYEQKGSAYEKRIQSEKLAEANKVFAHFNW